PALNFSPFSEKVKLTQDVNQAQKLMSDAGFAEGKDFPAIQLVINRNDVQKRIARAVSKMWKKNLNVETEIIVKETEDYDQALKNGEFDIARRGVVLPTSDETANMLAMFPPKPEPKKEIENQKSKTNIPTVNEVLKEKSAESKLDFSVPPNSAPVEEKPKVSAPDNVLASGIDENSLILTEAQALEALPAIPLYFPTSYSLVKPYVIGFEINALDAPSLKNVSINNDWQPSSQKILSND
ncbi:MAG: ABC transporter substrate-binding protein, partial [Pyrinomonadaceae bacterium]